MSSRFLRPLALGTALFIAAVSLRFGIAGAASVDAMLSGQLEPSQAPALLAPITESGRTGWACKPEHAASSAAVRESDLPSAHSKP